MEGIGLQYTNFLSSDLPQQHAKLFFHFTSVDKLSLILSNNCLKACNLVSMNDIREAELYHEFLAAYSNDIPQVIKEECKILCFSKNMKGKNGIMRYGYKRPRMWAQYANNFTGCCLVIDEVEFKKENPKINYEHGYFCDNVKYVNIIPTIPLCNSNNVYAFFKANSKSMFFTKQKDWSGEGEKRFVLFSKKNDVYFNIRKSLKAIIFAKSISENVQIIYKLIDNEQIAEVELYRLVNNNGHLGVISQEAVLNDILIKFGNLLKMTHENHL